MSDQEEQTNEPRQSRRQKTQEAAPEPAPQNPPIDGAQASANISATKGGDHRLALVLDRVRTARYNVDRAEYPPEIDSKLEEAENAIKAAIEALESAEADKSDYEAIEAAKQPQ